MPFPWELKQDKFRAEIWDSNEWVLCDLSENGCIDVVKGRSLFSGLKKRMGRGNVFHQSELLFQIIGNKRKENFERSRIKK